MSILHLYPKETDTGAQSVRLHELFDAVNRYMDGIIGLIAVNRSHSRLKLMGAQSGAASG